MFHLFKQVVDIFIWSEIKTLCFNGLLAIKRQHSKALLFSRLFVYNCLLFIAYRQSYCLNKSINSRKNKIYVLYCSILPFCYKDSYALLANFSIISIQIGKFGLQVNSM